MTCRHENTTGWMWRENIGPSKHLIPSRWEYAFRQPGVVGHHDRIVCDDCGAWLPLGSSDETDPRVAVEIRAAEIVATFHESDWPFASWHTTQDENLGWRFDDAAPHTLGYDAGRLARCIADHDSATEREGRR